MMNRALVVFVSKVHKLNVKFFWINNEGCLCKLIPPSLEDLRKLW
jgi:hypothetical protein